MEYKSFIREVPDFPKPGILFYDITTILQNPPAFRAVIEAFVERYSGAKKPDAIVAMEARGFLFAAPLAEKMGLPLITKNMRKASAVSPLQF